MKIFEALKWAHGRTNSRYVSRELLKFSENLSNEEFVMLFNHAMRNEEKFRQSVEIYASGVPLEYITNKCKFFDFEFFVDERVLIPRFETEILVDKAFSVAHLFKTPRICEVGTGSGIISICLKKFFPDAQITATDISESALEVARKNAQNLGVDIEFVHCEYLSGVQGDFDIVVSNPPYIASSYKLDERVLKEPNLALIGGERGDEKLKKLIFLSENRTKYLLCEMGYDQKQSMQETLSEHGFAFEFYKDLAGFDRGFVARKMN
ncbi:MULTISPECIES: peptide chain release factor N(5)-glutamine methyltransferase [unclassified Campylobacter]|uniref:peptide chain release factor N(5)-glutamine methyltransferase n=1 Tax=unclassified Campylobacter TaxID=2593542 RepID=UPI0022E9C9AA|nr:MULTISPECIES: peptide chain release factor N(5)-glutamine methyltransferase [unclassified Campylobacter]MDA3042453.1 peptide chain release factor N(5)-glutamine methyltransferase [Campylobacter sp. JMF_09 ED2]MDA3044733.1 peptide chain release factor N(5)-glutamine methyltransferase [Campylobacter sp. JMF_07 ED4]MDA3063145.1 peptide chain release factor N(5)-glutamine methyltransferase [Campylobacter sp. JMF_11 EL3]MDA3071710.1 peptide chain release factor N(5)-glutamine methyltransferase [C